MPTPQDEAEVQTLANSLGMRLEPYPEEPSEKEPSPVETESDEPQADASENDQDALAAETSEEAEDEVEEEGPPTDYEARVRELEATIKRKELTARKHQSEKDKMAMEFEELRKEFQEFTQQSSQKQIDQELEDLLGDDEDGIPSNATLRKVLSVMEKKLSQSVKPPEQAKPKLSPEVVELEELYGDVTQVGNYAVSKLVGKDETFDALKTVTARYLYAKEKMTAAPKKKKPIAGAPPMKQSIAGGGSTKIQHGDLPDIAKKFASFGERIRQPVKLSNR